MVVVVVELELLRVRVGAAAGGGGGGKGRGRVGVVIWPILNKRERSGKEFWANQSDQARTVGVLEASECL